MTQSPVAVADSVVQINDAVDPMVIAGVLERQNGNRCGLIGALQEIQNLYGYLPEKALRLVAQMTQRSLVDVYSVATFYRSFSLKPRGEHTVLVCLGTACHVRGAPTVVEEFERQLGIKAGDTTPDMKFTLETVNCLGACALGPIVVLDGEYFPKVDASKVRRILERARANGRSTGSPELHMPPIEETASRAVVG